VARGRKKAAKGGAVKLVRRHKESGEISARKRGRPHPDYETGYLDADGQFKPGNPRGGGRRRRRGRPAGRPTRRATTAGRKPAGGLNEIESIVRREVDSRLRAAKAAALEAFNRALGL
jgi:hypothetical protein